MIYTSCTHCRSTIAASIVSESCRCGKSLCLNCASLCRLCYRPVSLRCLVADPNLGFVCPACTTKPSNRPSVAESKWFYWGWAAVTAVVVGWALFSILMAALRVANQ